ncbi:MAG: hypothetical protein LBQ54_05445 [Planctomycetaceae bacterium]|nr:hypothetical protein [Planctomycetaceae bacterium]
MYFGFFAIAGQSLHFLLSCHDTCRSRRTVSCETSCHETLLNNHPDVPPSHGNPPSHDEKPCPLCVFYYGLGGMVFAMATLHFATPAEYPFPMREAVCPVSLLSHDISVRGPPILWSC